MSEISQDDIDLNYYEGVRRNVVKELSKTGVPTDPEMLNILLKAADGGSKIIIAKKRLEADKEDNGIKSQTLNLVSELLRRVPTEQQKKTREALPVVDLVSPLPGETSVGTKALTFNDIMSNERQSP